MTNEELFWLWYDTSSTVLRWIFGTASTAIGNLDWALNTNNTAAAVVKAITQISNQVTARAAG